MFVLQIQINSSNCLHNIEFWPWVPSLLFCNQTLAIIVILKLTQNILDKVGAESSHGKNIKIFSDPQIVFVIKICLRKGKVQNWMIKAPVGVDHYELLPGVTVCLPTVVGVKSWKTTGAAWVHVVQNYNIVILYTIHN